MSARLFPLFLIALIAGAQQRMLWRDPGDIAAVDLGATAGARVKAPQPPFTFLREDPSGTQPKMFVRDAAGATWNVKFGYEVKNECFCWRIVRACGYFAEPSFFVGQGQVQGFKPLKRAAPSLHPDGRFTDARFQFRDPTLEYVSGRNWRWDRPPYAGMKELSGLKILIMLFSNWDNKDGRVKGNGANTAIFHEGKQLIYAFTDWGSGMGRWGAGVSGQTDWRCGDFTQQTPAFVKGVEHGGLVFGWDGHIESGFKTGIPVAHAAWFMRYLGRITDAQLRAALKAAGASDADADCFTKALRSRIEQIARASQAGS